MAQVTYEVDDDLRNLAPTQKEFEELVKALQPFNLHVSQLMRYMSENGLFEAVALQAPLMGEWFDHDQ